MSESAPAQESQKRQYACPGCAAALEFQPGAKELACPYCGRREAIAQDAEHVEELSYLEYLRSSRIPVAKLGEKQVRCNGCGATTGSNDLARNCPFCGSGLVVEVASEELITPNAVLPFKIAKGDAQDRFRRWIASLWFAPSQLKKLAADEGMRGIYVPHWTYDAETRTFYSGERGEHYWITQTYTEMVNGQAQTRTRQVQQTRWWPASGNVGRFFDDVLVPAVAKTFTTKELDQLQPWDLDSAVAYEPSYLAGFQALRYEVDLEPGFEACKRIMDPTILADCRKDIGGDEQRVHSRKTQYSAITFKHVLLPVWLAAYRFRDKTWRVRINARTGELAGERPYSAAKIATLVAVVIVVVVLVIVLTRK